jgi:RNA polymerase sigma factor, sigma-70 family
MDDREAVFNHLIDEHLPMLRSVAYRVTGNAADTDEAIQLALLSAWKKFDTFRGNAKMSSWVYRITVNASYDILRARERESRKLAAYAATPAVPENDNSDVERLEAAIAELPELYREAIVLGVLSDLDGRTAAERLGCSPNTLYQRIHKAKQLLRQTYREVQYE